jgi:ATP-dependent DNA ligase
MFPQVEKFRSSSLRTVRCFVGGSRITSRRLPDKSPVENPPGIPDKVQWVQPKLVCEVAFSEWTTDQQLRQTTFLGWRDDKNPEEAVLEQN